VGTLTNSLLKGTLALLLVGAATAQTRKPAPDFTARDADGNEKRLSDFRGQVVLVNFWATWCGPCRIEIPWLQKLHDQYAAEGFTVIGVSIDAGGWPVVEPFVAEYGFTYPVLLARAQVVSLYSGKTSLPQTLILDREGRVADSYEGLLGEAALRNIIEPLLAEGQTVTEAPEPQTP